MRFVNVDLKVANMKKDQQFTVYPTKIGAVIVYLQSDKRFVMLDINTGKGVINSKNQTYANSVSVMMSSIEFELLPEKLAEVREKVALMQSRQNADGSITLIG